MDLKMRVQHTQHGMFSKCLVMPVFIVQRMLEQYRPMLYWPSIRPPICLSVTRRYYLKTAKHRIMETAQDNSPWTLVF